MFSPYVRLAHDFRPAQPLTLGPCCINDHALHYFRTGNGVYEMAGERFAIQPNSLFLAAPGVPFSISATPDIAMHMLNIHFDLIERNDSAKLLWPYPSDGRRREFSDVELLSTHAPALKSPTPIFISDPISYEGLFYRVHNMFGPRDFAGALQLKSAMLDLLAYVARACQQRDASLVSVEQQHTITLAMQYLREHFQEPIRLADVAATVSLSVSHCGELFKAFYGTSPMKHLTSLRIERAKLELSLGNMPIKQIAQLVGYDSVHHFSHAFKRETQLSPAVFRRFYTPKSEKTTKDREF